MPYCRGSSSATVTRPSSTNQTPMTPPRVEHGPRFVHGTGRYVQSTPAVRLATGRSTTLTFSMPTADVQQPRRGPRGLRMQTCPTRRTCS